MAKRTGNYKAGPGRPKGSKNKPREPYGRFPVQRCIRMTQEQLDHLMTIYGDASVGVRALIDADMPPPHDENDSEGEVSHNQ